MEHYRGCSATAIKAGHHNSYTENYAYFQYLLVEELRRVLEILCVVSTMFTCSAITPQEVNGFGWNLGNSEYIVWSWPWPILRVIRAEARAGDLAEFLFFFCQVNNARLCRFPVSQFSRNLHTKRVSVTRWILSETFFALKGSFFQKPWSSSIISDFRPRFLGNDYTSWNMMTGWRAYGMLAFHPYRWNQLKVIRLASRLRIRKDFPMRRFAMIYILKTPSNNAPNEW